MSINSITLLGHVGKQPEIKVFNNGGKVISFSLATSERWKGKDGQQQERTQWHDVVCYNEHLVSVIERFVSVGSKIAITNAAIEYRTYEKDGATVKVTEVVLRPFKGDIDLQDSKQDSQGQQQQQAAPQQQQQQNDDYDDQSIPF